MPRRERGRGSAASFRNPEQLLEEGAGRRILLTEQMREQLDDRDPGAEPVEELTEFRADDTAPGYDETLGNLADLRRFAISSRAARRPSLRSLARQRQNLLRLQVFVLDLLAADIKDSRPDNAPLRTHQVDPEVRDPFLLSRVVESIGDLIPPPETRSTSILRVIASAAPGAMLAAWMSSAGRRSAFNGMQAQ